MTQHRFQELDQRGSAYLHTQLAHANPLGRSFMNHVDLGSGKVLTVLPQELVGEPYRFGMGLHARPEARHPVPGGYAEHVPSTEDFVASWLSNVLSRRRDSTLVCESFVLRAAHVQAFENAKTVAMTSGDFVYRLATEQSTRDELLECLNFVYAVPSGCAVITTLPLPPGATRILSEEWRDEAARHAVALLMGAYDGESALVWVQSADLVPVVAQ